MNIVQLNKYLAVFVIYGKTLTEHLVIVYCKGKAMGGFMEVFSINSIVTPEQTLNLNYLFNCGNYPFGLRQRHGNMLHRMDYWTLIIVGLAIIRKFHISIFYKMLPLKLIAPLVHKMHCKIMKKNYDCTSIKVSQIQHSCC